MAATGAWVAYDEEQGAALFSSEISAYRYANGRGQKVAPWPFGLTLIEAIAASEQEQGK